MESLKSFQYFNNCKLHYNQRGYDIRKYFPNQKRFSLDKFQEDHGKYFYTKLCETHPEEIIKPLIWTNLFINPDVWINDMLTDQAWNNYLWTKKYRDAMTNYFFEDVKYLREKYGKLTEADIFKEIMAMKIHPQTVSLLAKLIPDYRENCLRRHGNVVYETVCLRLIKYDAFVSVPTPIYLQSLKERMKVLYSNNKK